MSVRFYFDHNVRQAILHGLRRHSVDCLAARDNGHAQASDELLLTRATELGRVLYTEDTDFLRIATRWQHDALSFAGIVFGRQDRLSVAQAIENLRVIALASEPEEWHNRIEYLPL